MMVSAFRRFNISLLFSILLCCIIVEFGVSDARFTKPLFRNLKMPYAGDENDYYNDEEFHHSSIASMSYTDYEENHITLDLNGTIKRELAYTQALISPRKDMVCSSISALIPMAQIAIGATGSSRQELMQAIGLHTNTEIRKSFQNLFQMLRNLPGVELNIASKMYISKTESVQEKYQRKLKKYFGSGLIKLNFNKPATAAEAINLWVSRETGGKIESIVTPDSISPETSLILINAIYFKGYWKKKFDPAIKQPFETPKGTKHVKMMNKAETVDYINSYALDAQIVSIPYKGGKASLVVVLPLTTDGLPTLLAKLKVTPELLSNALQQMRPTKLTISMPKFKIDTEIDLKNLYQKVGIESVFDPSKAKLKKIVTSNIYISDAIQKSIIEVTERGTSAASATAVHGSKLSVKGTPLFVANHSFYFTLLVETQQLFNGIYTGS